MVYRAVCRVYDEGWSVVISRRIGDGAFQTVAQFPCGPELESFGRALSEAGWKVLGSCGRIEAGSLVFHTAAVEPPPGWKDPIFWLHGHDDGGENVREEDSWTRSLTLHRVDSFRAGWEAAFAVHLCSAELWRQVELLEGSRRTVNLLTRLFGDDLEVCVSSEDVETVDLTAALTLDELMERRRAVGASGPVPSRLAVVAGVARAVFGELMPMEGNLGLPFGAVEDARRAAAARLEARFGSPEPLFGRVEELRDAHLLDADSSDSEDAAAV